MQDQTPSLSDAFIEYEDNKIKIKELEERNIVLNPIIAPAVTDEEELLTDKGFYYIQKRLNYTYTKGTTEAIEEVKQRQKDEIATGEAKVASTNRILVYKQGVPKEPKVE